MHKYIKNTPQTFICISTRTTLLCYLFTILAFRYYRNSVPDKKRSKQKKLVFLQKALLTQKETVTKLRTLSQSLDVSQQTNVRRTSTEHTKIKRN